MNQEIQNNRDLPPGFDTGIRSSLPVFKNTGRAHAADRGDARVVHRFRMSLSNSPRIVIRDLATGKRECTRCYGPRADLIRPRPPGLLFPALWEGLQPIKGLEARQGAVLSSDCVL